MGIQRIDGQSTSYQPNLTTPNSTVEARAIPAPAPSEANLDSPVQGPSDTTHTSSSQLEKATAQAQARLRDAGSDLSFSIDKESGRTVVKLIDPTTQEVIRQIPSKEMLAISHNLDKTIQGLLIHQKA